MRLCLLLLVLLSGCGGDDPVRPESGSARVWVAPDAQAFSVDATLVTETVPYPTFHLDRGQEDSFTGLPLHTPHHIVIAYQDSTGPGSITKDFSIGVDGGVAEFSFTASGYSGP